MAPTRIIIFVLLAVAVALLAVLVARPQWLGLGGSASNNGNNGNNGGNNGGNGGNNGNSGGNSGGNRPRACEFDILPGQDNDDVAVCADSDCSREVDSVEECQRACCQDDLCEAAQYREDTRRCLLKHDVGDIRDASDKKTLLVKKRVRFDV